MKAKNLIKTAMAMLLMTMAVGCLAEEIPQTETKATDVSCPEATDAVNKLIQADASLSQTRHFIDITFKAAVSLTSDETEKKNIQDDQCKWVVASNQCKDQSCLISNIKDRFNALLKYNHIEAEKHKGKKHVLNKTCPEVRFMNNESDKEICISRVLNSDVFNLKWVNLYGYTQGEKLGCEDFANDFVKDKNSIKYVEPILRTKSIKDAILKPYIQCSDSKLPVYLESGKSIRLFNVTNKTGDGQSDSLWLYVDDYGCLELETTNRTLCQPRFLTSLDKSDCQVQTQLALGLGNEEEDINTIIFYKDSYYFLQGDKLFMHLYKYDETKSAFTKNECEFQSEYSHNLEINSGGVK